MPKLLLIIAILISVLSPSFASASDNTLANQTQAFVEQYWSRWSETNSSALPYIATLVGNQITFYGKSISHDDYMKIQLQFANRWPNRDYTLELNSFSTACNDTSSLCKVSGLVDWIDSSPARNSTSIGSAKFSFDLSVKQNGGNYSFQFEAQSGSVVHRTLLNESSAANTIAPPIPQNSSQINVSSGDANETATIIPATAPTPDYGNTVPASSLAPLKLEVTDWTTSWSVDDVAENGDGPICEATVEFTLHNLGDDMSFTLIHVDFLNVQEKSVYSSGEDSADSIPSGYSNDFKVEATEGRLVDAGGCITLPLLTARVTLESPASGINSTLIAEGLIDPEVK